MNASDIEHIVAEVIRRLQAAAVTAAPTTVVANDDPKQPTASLSSVGGTSGMPITLAKTKQRPDAPRVGRPAGSGDVWETSERLLTLATVEGKLDGLRRLVVHRKAIVTPALREELSRRNIALDRGGVAGVRKAECSLGVVRFDAERAPSLHGLGLAEDVVVKSVSSLLQKVREQLSPSRLVVVLTKQTAVALCALNRINTIRAAVASNVETLRSATQTLAANVLVIDPAHLGRVQLAAILRAFETEGVRDVPNELKELL